MVSLRGPALGPLMSLLETASANSRLHLNTIRPSLQQSSQDLRASSAECLSTGCNAYERSGGRRWLQAVCAFGGTDSSLLTERANYLEIAKAERKAGGGPVASGKYSRRYGNFFPARTRPTPAAPLAPPP